MGLYRANCLILKTRNFGEADRVVVLLSEDTGKFEAVVKGARRQRSRFVGNTLPFNLIKALLLTGKSLDTLSQVELIRSFSRLREDLVSLAYASYWVELIDGFLPERESVKEVFRFILAAFIVLEQASDQELVNLAFEARMLNYLGYQPQLSACAGCGSPVTKEVAFSTTAGGIICLDCRLQYRDFLLINPKVIETYQLLLTTDLRQLFKLEIAKVERQLMQQVLLGFIENRIDRPLKSRTFLNSMVNPLV